MYINYKLVGKKASTTGREAFDFYKKESIHRNKKEMREPKNMAKVLNLIYEKVRDGAVEYEGGVYAPSYFYMIPQPFPNKRFIKVLQKGGEYKGTLNVKTGGRVFTLLFVNIFSKKEHRMWDMSNSFFDTLKSKFSKFIKSNSFRYLFSLHTLKKVR